MTLVSVWVRRIGETEELIVTTDSRLRQGSEWDCCPKIILLPRSDAVICFAGSTLYAYPMMLQIANTISSHSPLINRAVDFGALCAYAKICGRGYACSSDTVSVVCSA
jgi:hypothetical protein